MGRTGSRTPRMITGPCGLCPSFGPIEAYSVLVQFVGALRRVPETTGKMRMLSRATAVSGQLPWGASGVLWRRLACKLCIPGVKMPELIIRALGH